MSEGVDDVAGVDPFDKISIYQSTSVNTRASFHARDVLADAEEETVAVGKWVICRFSPAADGEYGWPLRKLDTAGSEPLRAMVADGVLPCLGWNSEADVAFFDMETARSIAADPPPSAAGLLFDQALPAAAVAWRTLLYSSYDGKWVEMYRGRDYAQAARAFGVARFSVAKAKGVYLKAMLEGVARRNTVSP